MQAELVKSNNLKKEYLEGVHYYLENGNTVFTKQYHKERGWCCGSKCRHCPYHPIHQKGNQILWDQTNQPNTKS